MVVMLVFNIFNVLTLFRTAVDLSTLKEERSSTLGSVAGQINANNRDLEQLQSELIRLREIIQTH